jgi:hypothetical protein
MAEWLGMLLVGVAILVAMVTLGRWAGGRFARSPRGRAAAAQGWVYEGHDAWSFKDPQNHFYWRARQTSVPIEDSSDPQVELDVSLLSGGSLSPTRVGNLLGAPGAAALLAWMNKRPGVRWEVRVDGEILRLAFPYRGFDDDADAMQFLKAGDELARALAKVPAAQL